MTLKLRQNFKKKMIKYINLISKIKRGKVQAIKKMNLNNQKR